MKIKFATPFGILALALSLSLAPAAHAQLVTQSFDFGSDIGKDGDGGFNLIAQNSPPPNDTAAWSTQADSLRYSRGADNANQNAFALIQNNSALSNNFTIQSTVTLNSTKALAPGNADRFGLSLFTPATPGNSDGVQLVLGNVFRTAAGGGPLLLIRQGINGTVLASAAWSGTFPFTVGTVFTFTGDVTYTGPDVNVSFTLASGIHSQVISHTFISPTFANDNFGFASRTTSGLIVDYDTFAIIPEPSTYLLLGLGLGALVILRRKQSQG